MPKPYKSYVGRVAAGSLGFIVDDVPGAYAGYQAFRNYESYRNKKQMPRGRPRTRSVSYSKAARGLRRSSRIAKRKRSSSGSVYGTPAPYMKGNQVNVVRGASSGKIVGKSRKKFTRGVRKVKVSAKLKRGIKQVMNGNRPFGHHRQVFQDSIAPFTGTNLQTISQIPVRATESGTLFSPNDLVHSVSRVFGEKGSDYTPNITDADNILADNLKVDVTKAAATYTLVNNTQRSMTVRMYVCKPKRAWVDSAHGPYVRWSEAIAMEIVAGTLKGNPTPTVGSLYDVPTKYAQFNSWYTCETTDFVMEPGTTVQQKVAGETGRYDLKKSYDGGTFMYINQKNRHVMFSTMADLTYGQPDGAGVKFAARYDPDAAGDDETLLIETVYDLQFTMPEQAGFVTPSTFAADTLVLNTKRQSTYVFDQHGTAASIGSGSIKNINAVNPALTTA